MTKRRNDPITPRNIGPAAVAVDEELRRLGCTDIVFTKTKHARVAFNVGPISLKMSVPCTPRDDDAAAANSIRKVRKLIAEACAEAVQ